MHAEQPSGFAFAGATLTFLLLSPLPASAQSSHVTQSGTGDTAEVVQDSSTDSVTIITQGGGTGGNNAAIEQTGAQRSGSEIQQSGTLNRADTLQTDTEDSGITVEQAGTGHQADVTQTASTGTHGTVYQYDGTANRSSKIKSLR